MQRKKLVYLAAVLALLIASFTVAAMAGAPPAGAAPQGPADPETALEQAKALAAEQAPAVSPVVIEASPGGDGYPLFVGVDDVNVPAYTIDPATNAMSPHALGVQIWGAAFDPASNAVYINNGSTLYKWPVGGAVSALGTVTDPAGAPQALVGLAFYAGALYASKNIANEAIYEIDLNTLVATVAIDYPDGDFDFGGLAADPKSGDLYATNDDATPHGTGLFRINQDGSATQIAPYPAGETDIDGLAIGNDGNAYLVIDQPGNIYVYDFSAAAYVTPLTNPWTTSEVFSAGAYLLHEPTAVALRGLASASAAAGLPSGAPLAALPAAAAAALGAIYVCRRRR
jgi:hypothetical protein